MDEHSLTMRGAPGGVRPAGTATRQTAPAGQGVGSTRTLWVLYVLLMLFFGVYLGINHIIGAPRMAPWKPFTWEMSSAVMITVLLPLIVRWEQRFRVDGRPRTPVVLAHLAGALVFSGAHVSGMVALRKLVYALAGTDYEFSFHSSLLWDLLYELQKDLITYAIVLIIVFAAREFRVRRAGELRAAEITAELTAARLAHLTAQIEPHFLFNSLNAISNRMHEDVAAADRMISQLGDLLRAVYATGDSPLVPLGTELKWLTSYAAMMSERFRGQLIIEVRAQPGLESVRVPRLLLQPLVENALRHGLSEGRGRLDVEVSRQDGRILCTVRDDGAGLPAGPVLRGTGLANIARRLELLYPGDHSLDILARQPGGTEVRVSLPVSP